MSAAAGLAMGMGKLLHSLYLLRNNVFHVRVWDQAEEKLVWSSKCNLFFLYKYTKTHKSRLPYCTSTCSLLQPTYPSWFSSHMRGKRSLYGKLSDLWGAWLPYSVWTPTILPLLPHAPLPPRHSQHAIIFFLLSSLGLIVSEKLWPIGIKPMSALH